MVNLKYLMHIKILEFFLGLIEITGPPARGKNH